MTAGPLHGLRVLEFDGLGPVPFSAMLLADLGADVVRITRPGAAGVSAYEIYHRGRPAVALDLKDVSVAVAVCELTRETDLLIEGFRPGVMERLGLGPDELLAVNPALVYGRMTGWGQDGPWAGEVGHDINYLAVSGALDSFRRRGERPVAPINLLGDFGGGALYLIVGMLSALHHARATGTGQVVDAAMVDGVASLMASVCGRIAAGTWDAEPGTNLLDTGAPFYEVYATSDQRHVAVGAIEPRFYAALLSGLGFHATELPDQFDRRSWPAIKGRFAERFAQRGQREWIEVFAGTEACVTPVLSLAEAQRHPHLRARGTYLRHDGITQPAPAPRFSATPTALGANASPNSAWAARMGHVATARSRQRKTCREDEPQPD